MPNEISKIEIAPTVRHIKLEFLLGVLRYPPFSICIFSLGPIIMIHRYDLNTHVHCQNSHHL